MVPLVYLQVRTILVMLRLDRKLLRTEPEAATPAPTAA
jgi:hypothetical protein